jgi:hypothetical protein
MAKTKIDPATLKRQHLQGCLDDLISLRQTVEDLADSDELSEDLDNTTVDDDLKAIKQHVERVIEYLDDRINEEDA